MKDKKMIIETNVLMTKKDEKYIQTLLDKGYTMDEIFKKINFNIIL